MPTHYKGTPTEVLALDTYIKLVRATDSVMSRLQKGGRMGLTPTQFAVLETLYHLGAMPQSDIGSKLLKSGGNITLVLDNLEKQGLVRRERSKADRRVVIVSLSDKGRELIADLFPAHVAAIVEQMSSLNPDEQRMLGELCRKLGKQSGGHTPSMRQNLADDTGSSEGCD